MELQWPLILFTTLIAWSAGLFATQALYAWRGEGMKSQLAAWAVSAVLLVAGGVSVFFHLQHWERIFNGFGHITSGITQELIAIVALAAVAVVYLVFLRRLPADGEGGEGDEAGEVADSKMPVWLCWLAVAVAAVLVVVMGHSYMMPSRPAWDSVLQVGSLLGAACALGPLTMMAVCAVRGDEIAFGRKLAFGGAAAGAVLVVLYAVCLQLSSGMFPGVADYYFDTPHPNRGITDVSGVVAAQAPMLWVGAVVVGAVVPLVAALLARKGDGARLVALGSAGAACAFVGALCLRVAFYGLGLSAFLMF